MQFLKEWVRGLVMLVLLAGVLEMLVPQNAMKRYVRMVMGLLVVLGVLQPVLQLLGQQVVVDPTGFAQSPDGRLPSVSQVMARAAAFREKNQRLLLKEASERLGAMAREAARSLEGVADAAAEVALEPDGKGGYRVAAVHVTVIPDEGAGRLVEPVRPVEPVRIGPDRAEPDTLASRLPDPVAEELLSRVRQQVADRLGVDADPEVVQVRLQRQRREGTGG